VVQEAINSVLDQTFRDFEVVVVDDGSTDNTLDVVARFKDPRIRIVRHGENCGYAHTMNTGFAESRGELVSILDSDDLWKPEKLEYETAFLDRHPEVHAVFSDLEKEDGAERITSFMRTTPVFSRRLAGSAYPQGIDLPQREMFLCLLQEVPIKPTAFTVRRQALQCVGLWDESWPSANDWEFFLRFSKVYRFGYIDQPLAVLRVQRDATHRLHREKDLIFVTQFLRRERAQLATDIEARAAVQSGVADITRHLAWYYFDTGRRGDAARTFWRGFRETRHAGLLLRAIATYIPRSLRSAIKLLTAREGD
jgi:glycosyltransferase involved in cell wall biosynthesis